MEFWNTAILVGALLLVVSIVASDVSSRLGAPLLLVFMLLGMVAGEDGPGGIRFDDFELSYVIGTLALAVIIFDGGMRTRRETFRVTLWPAASLATVGVVVTAVLVGLFAAWVLGPHLAAGAADRRHRRLDRRRGGVRAAARCRHHAAGARLPPCSKSSRRATTRWPFSSPSR